MVGLAKKEADLKERRTFLKGMITAMGGRVDGLSVDFAGRAKAELEQVEVALREGQDPQFRWNREQVEILLPRGARSFPSIPPVQRYVLWSPDPLPPAGKVPTRDPQISP